MSWHFENAIEPIGTITEGPVWDGNAIIFTNIANSRILRYCPTTRDLTVLRSHTYECNGLALDGDKKLYGCEGGSAGRRVVRYNEDGSTDVVASQYEGKHLNSPNDLIVDRGGRVWFTDPRYGDYRSDMELEHESVYRCDPQPDGSWTVNRMTQDTSCPNGLVLSPDETTLYVAESKYGEGEHRELRAYPVLADGTLGSCRVLHNFYPHRGIDGMRVDAAGNIIATAGWSESGPGPMIYVFAPSGRVLATHPLPEDLPTNCCFGDLDLHGLYVTTIGGHLLCARLK